jgi:iron complex outermembrane recepter protein
MRGLDDRSNFRGSLTHFAGRVGRLLLATVAMMLAPYTEAQSLDQIVITATRVPTPISSVPVTVSVISGSELQARGSQDMASALSLSPGTEAPAGGDAGPASAVPSFWGLHEFDAFLLVLDDVPWGGAFNPSISTLDFTDVQRVEILKGAAPVMYGATSFVGVVHVIHYPAGEASDEAHLAYGTYGSWRGSASTALPVIGGLRQSLSVDGRDSGFADARERVANGHALYRGALALDEGTLRLDLSLNLVHQIPTSPVLRTGTALSPVTPSDANFNPADARIDENQYQLALGYTRPMIGGNWDTLASLSYSTVTDIRAFLHPDLSGTADTQNQNRTIQDGYFDTHWAKAFGTAMLVAGADALYGRGRQTSLNGNDAYTLPLDGSVLPPPTYAIPVTEIGTLEDRRVFAGQYMQVDWKVTERWAIEAGMRLNETYEHKKSSDYTVPPPELLAADVSKTVIKPAEVLGVSYRLWSEGTSTAVIYADYRNAFKPAAIDFGPDYTPDLLSPETAQSYELGLRGWVGPLSYQAEAFALDFKNLVVPTSSGALANAAGEKLRGVEAEARFQASSELALVATAAYHNATFSRYLFFDGLTNVDVAGDQLPLSPHVLAAVGVLYTPRRGFNGSAVARYAGRRFLDEENTAPVGGYTTLDATVGYSFGRAGLTLEGSNLTNQRPPVTSSEFGSASFYLLPARMIWLKASYSWR